MNRNVRNTLAFYPALTICTSLATSSTLAAYILLRTGSNVKVGLAVGAQGMTNLLAAFPAAWLGDRYSRPRVIRVSVVLGLAGMACLCGAVLSPYDSSARLQYASISASLMILGLFMGGHSASVEAIFGDSVESGKRSALYARKSALKVLGNAAGPVVSIAVFASLGDHWKREELEVAIACGCAFFVVPAVLGVSLSEAHTLGGRLSESLLAPPDGAAGGDVASDDASSDAGSAAPPSPKAGGRRTEVRIAATVCVADVVSMLGSGMTIKFFPLFFWKEVGLSPIQVQVIYVLAPSGIAACSLVAQRVSRKVGRVQTTVATKLAGISLLVAMSQVGDGPTVVVLYLLRTWLMNCCMGLTRSVLNDYVRKAERARWNAAESINLFSWSGSAALGGFIIDRYGYRATFLVTAAIQVVAAGILASIALLVERERPSSRRRRRRTGGPDDDDNDDGDETASRASSAGYSLLDFDESLQLESEPPAQMTDAQIDELLLQTADLVTPTKLRRVSEGDETREISDSPPPSSSGGSGAQYTTL